MDSSATNEVLDNEWDRIAELIDKIGDLTSAIDGGWPELENMIADILTKEGNNKSPEKVFFNVYTFLLRLYYRVKANPTVDKLNKVSYNDNHAGEPAFAIQNYDYNAFVWAVKNGFTDRIDNNVIFVLAKDLSPEMEKSLRLKAKQ